MLGLLFFCLFFSYLISCDKNLLKKLFFSFVFSFALLIFDGYFQYFFGYNIVGFKLAEGPRVSSFFGDELILGSYVTRFFPIYIGLYFYQKQIKKISSILKKFWVFIHLKTQNKVTLANLNSMIGKAALTSLSFQLST